eukprot:4443148-Amphidinium_carterae.1
MVLAKKGSISPETILGTCGGHIVRSLLSGGAALTHRVNVAKVTIKSLLPIAYFDFPTVYFGWAANVAKLSEAKLSCGHSIATISSHIVAQSQTVKKHHEEKWTTGL